MTTIILVNVKLISCVRKMLNLVNARFVKIMTVNNQLRTKIM